MKLIEIAKILKIIENFQFKKIAFTQPLNLVITKINFLKVEILLEKKA